MPPNKHNSIQAAELSTRMQSFPQRLSMVVQKVTPTLTITSLFFSKDRGTNRANPSRNTTEVPMVNQELLHLP